MSISATPVSIFWKGKRVLVTGHSGFKGAWLTLWLHRLGAEVTGISLPPATTPSLFSLAGVEKQCDSHFCDIRDASSINVLMKAAKPEIVFHLAAQSLVRASYLDPVSTFATNVMGTVNLLEAMRGLGGLRVAVMVTTDKVYRNNEGVLPYREDDVLGGHDPYSASKSASEIVIASYRDSFLSHQDIAVASARAGNVIGGGDWSKDRLIPDSIRAWQAGLPLEIRRPNSIRPWQHVLEPLFAYISLAQRLWEQPALAGAYNFGPETNETATVRDVVEIARKAYGGGEVLFGDGVDDFHEAGFLTLEVAKARSILGVKPRLSLVDAVTNTISWYRANSEGKDAFNLCQNEISAYEVMF